MNHIHLTPGIASCPKSETSFEAVADTNEVLCRERARRDAVLFNAVHEPRWEKSESYTSHRLRNHAIAFKQVPERRPRLSSRKEKDSRRFGCGVDFMVGRESAGTAAESMVVSLKLHQYKKFNLRRPRSRPPSGR